MSGMFVECDGTLDESKSKDRVIINCGGIRHECYISTIQNFPDTRLYWIAETALKMADFDPDGNEFFFDRHPQCFANILNYCRTGKLHCPNDVCGPLFEQELAFWGVDELMMEPCCWGGYTQHRNAHKNLSMFDEMRENEMGPEEEDDDTNITIKPLQHSRGKNKCADLFWHYRPMVWSVLEKPFSSVYAQVSAFISMMVILISLATFCAETVEYFRAQRNIFRALEYFYCGFFTLELLLRLCCCPSIKKYFLSLMTWIDIISTLQFYISFISQNNSLDFLFVSRLLRIFRLFRFFKNLSGMQVIAQTLKASANELLLLCIILLIPMVIFSTLVFYADFGKPNTKFASIPGTFWWTIITMTTVGYGDVTPTSLGGKVIGAFCACSGVLIVALPVSVIGSNFNLYYSYAQARMKLPKRKSPALVSADKALVTSNTDKQQNTGPEGEGIKNSLKGLASVMIDLNAMNPKSTTSSSSSPLPSPSLQHDRQHDRSMRRHAIHADPAFNSSSSIKKTTLEKKKKRKSRALSEVTINEEDLIIEEKTINNDNNNNDDDDDIGNINDKSTSYTEEEEHKDLNVNEFDDVDNVLSSSYSNEQDTRELFGISKHQTLSRQRSTSAPYNRKITSTIAQENSAPVSPSIQFRKRTVIHVDLTKYIPTKIGKSERKARHRKLTQIPVCHSDGSGLDLLGGSPQLHSLSQEEEATSQAPWMKAAENALNEEQDQRLLSAER